MLQKLRHLPHALAAITTVTLWSTTSQAQQRVGNLADELKDQFGQLGQAVVAGAFFVGIIMVITGLIKLKNAADNPNQAKYSDGLWRLAVGAGLIAIPAVTGILGASLGLGEVGNISQQGGVSTF